MSATDLTVITEIVLQSKTDLAPEMPDADFWEFFTAKELLRDYQLDPDEIESGIVGQTTQADGSDGGIDSMYLFVNGVPLRDVDQAKAISHKKGIIFDIIIIQSTRAKGFELSAVTRLLNTCESIFRIELPVEDFSETYNARLTDVIRRFRTAHTSLVTRQPEINVSVFYASYADTGTINETLSGKAKELETKIKETLATVTTYNFHFKGAREMITLWQKPRKFEFTLSCTQSVTDRKGGHVALVELGEYYRLITDEKAMMREYLFESNVRDYEGDVDVNKQIKATLESRNDVAGFWWLNNGITILAQKVAGTPTGLTLHEPQVVNGLQTSQVIFEYFRDSKLDPAQEKRHAIIRIIEPPDEAMQDRIIKATNSQTRIPPQLLRASDEIQRDIEIIFKSEGLHYDRRKNSWRKAGMPISKVVGMSELAQSVASIVMGEADHARARPSRYFKDNAIYKRVFSKKLSMRAYVVCAQLKKRVEVFMKQAVADKDVRTDLFFYVLMGVGYPAYKRRKPPFKDLDVSAIPNESFEQALSLVKSIYEKHGATDTAAKGPKMVVDLLTKLKSRRRPVPSRRRK